MEYRFQCVMHKPVIGEGRCTGLRAARHDSAPNRVDCQTETQHFEGVALLPASGALNVMHSAFVVCKSECAGALVHGLEIWEEHMYRGKIGELVANLYSPVIICA